MWPFAALPAQTLDDAWARFRAGDVEQALVWSDSIAQRAVLENDRADALSLYANALRRLGRPDEALHVHGKVLNMRRKLFGTDAPQAANSLINIGNCHNDLGQYAAAVRSFREAFSIQQKKLDPCDPEATLSKNGLGQSLLLAGLWEEALLHNRRVLEAQTACFGYESPLLSGALLNAANAYFESFAPGHLQQAERLLHRAAGITPNGPSPTSVIIYRNLGNVYSRSGDLEQARQHYQKALDMAADLPHIGAEELAACYYSIGGNSMDRGDFAPAAAWFRKALSVAGEHNPAFRADILNLYAICMRYLGNHETAILLLEEAVNTMQGVAPESRSVAGFYFNLGNCFLDRQETTSALYYFEKSVAAFPTGSDRRRHLSKVWSKMGEAYLAAGRPEAALRELFRALHQAGDAPAAEKSLLLIQTGRVLHRLNRLEEALKHYDQALKTVGFNVLRQQVDFPLETLSALAGRLAVLSRLAAENSSQSKWKVVADEYVIAVKRFNRIADPLSEGENSAVFRACFHDLYAGLAEAYYRLGEYDPAFFQTAFFYAEQGKAHQLKKTMRLFHADRSAEDLREGMQLRGHIVALEKQRMGYETQDRLWPTRLIEQLDSALLAEKLRYEHWVQKMQESTPSSEPSMPESDLLHSVQRSLKKRAILLHYSFGIDNLLVFVINKKHLEAFAIPLTAELDTNLELFYRKISTRPDFNAGDRDFAKEAHWLYRSLVAPLQLPSDADLVVVPDGILAYIPFEALLTGAPPQGDLYKSYPYLIQQHALSYRVSALLPDLRCRPVRARLLAVAPDYAGHSAGLSPLVFNEEEAGQVKAQWPKGELLNGKSATVDNFLKNAPHHSLLHVSAHGVVNNAFPDYSFLAFSAAEGPAPDVLFVSELASLSLCAEMTVLSACQTAKGPFFKGEGILSMARAMTAAGSRSVLASLWNVDDRFTADLMPAFYRHLKAGGRKDRALQRAKIDFIAQNDHLGAHPYYWSGFVLHGNTDAIAARLPDAWIILLLLICAGVIGYFLYLAPSGAKPILSYRALLSSRAVKSGKPDSARYKSKIKPDRQF
ncbi:MAG: CHAT domain-containing protein [Saprospiraceae bacterium]|nr:CHAT domain-containing protein [Saprospiraceae bacterium]